MAVLAHADPVLGDVLGVLDATVLRVVHVHDELRAHVADVAILDRTDPATVHHGAIVLAVGIDPEEGEAIALVDRAARTDAAAVVFRCGGQLPDRLTRAPITLCATPPELSWGQLYALLRTAMAGAGSGPEAAGVRVGDLFALADAVATAVGAPVTIEDPQWRVLAYSNIDGQPIDDARRQTILGRTPPEVWQRRLEEADVRSRLRTHEGVVRFEHEGLAPRLVAPVRAGGELIGTLWVAEGEEPLGPEAERELVRLADLAAIHLVAHRAADDLKRRERGAVVRALLAGEEVATARLRGPLATVAFEMAGPRWSGDPDRILSIVGLYAEGVHRNAMCAHVDDRLWAIVPGSTREALVEMAARVADRVDRVLGVPLRAAIGTEVAAVGDVPRSRRSAELALTVLRDRPDQRVVHVEDIRAHATVVELLELAKDLEGVRESRAAALPRELRATLRAWLDRHGDVAASAAELGIHPNTLRYRLRRVEEAGGIDLSDPEERLLAALALRLNDTTNPGA